MTVSTECNLTQDQKDQLIKEIKEIWDDDSIHGMFADEICFILKKYLGEGNTKNHWSEPE